MAQRARARQRQARWLRVCSSTPSALMYCLLKVFAAFWTAVLAFSPSTAPPCLFTTADKVEEAWKGVMLACTLCYALQSWLVPRAIQDYRWRGECDLPQIIAIFPSTLPTLLLSCLCIIPNLQEVDFPMCRDSNGAWFELTMLLCNIEATALCVLLVLTCSACCVLPVVGCVSTCCFSTRPVDDAFTKDKNAARLALLSNLEAFQHPGQRGDVESGEHAEPCSICVEDFKAGDKCKRLPCSISHIFHATCVDTWLMKSRFCPLCRTDVVGLLSSPPSVAEPADEPPVRPPFPILPAWPSPPRQRNLLVCSPLRLRNPLAQPTTCPSRPQGLPQDDMLADSELPLCGLGHSEEVPSSVSGQCSRGGCSIDADNTAQDSMDDSAVSAEALTDAGSSEEGQVERRKRDCQDAPPSELTAQGRSPWVAEKDELAMSLSDFIVLPSVATWYSTTAARDQLVSMSEGTLYTVALPGTIEEV